MSKKGFQLGSTNTPPSHSIQYLEKAADQWGAQLIRWPLIWLPQEVSQWSLEEYEAWLYPAQDKLDECLPTASKKGLKIIIDMHTPCGGDTTWAGKKIHRLFVEKWARKAFRRHWREIALRFRNKPGVFAYDILNEPAPHIARNWKRLLKKVVDDIREIDPDTKIILPAIGSDPMGFKKMRYYKHLHNVWYTTHFYRPADIVFQGYTHPTGVKYPNPNARKKHLRQWLQPARDFQLKHNCKIYIGEFNCSVFSEAGGVPNQPKWLKHCIQIFDEYGWHWTYHDYKGPTIWDPEVHAETTQLLKESFATD